MNDETFVENDFKYTVVDGYATLSSYCGSEKILSIPETLGGYSVTTIGKGAFFGCNGLTEVIIPDSVTSIVECAFWGCSNLIELTIPNSVTNIGMCAFGSCNGLHLVVSKDHLVYELIDGVLFDKTKNILHTYFAIKNSSSYTIPNSVATIGDSAFFDCGSLTEVIIPHSVTTIGDWAFQRCKNLNKVTIPNSVTSIGKKAFDGCRSLTEVTIPDSVTRIGEEAFEPSVIIRGSKNSFDQRYAIREELEFAEVF